LSFSKRGLANLSPEFQQFSGFISKNPDTPLKKPDIFILETVYEISFFSLTIQSFSKIEP